MHKVLQNVNTSNYTPPTSLLQYVPADTQLQLVNPVL